jgi:predicted O-methyltransferase YrrM
MAAGTFTTADGRVHEIFPTSVAPDRGQAILDWVRKAEAASTIETGLAHGVATLFICEGLLLTGHPDVHHVAFDPYQRAAYSDVGRQVIDEAGLTDIVEIHEQDSKIGLAKLVEQNRRFDLAFVDGDHRFESVFIDLVFFNQLVRPGGIVIVDDLYLPAVDRASRFATTNLGWTSEQTEIGEEGRMAVFRLPSIPRMREWDEYVDF